MQDTIKREIEITASKEQIFEAIADPKKVVLWFPDKVEGSYKVGEQPIFDFGEHGKNQIYIQDSKPYEYFSYRWVPGSNHFTGDVLSVANTLVEFTIKEIKKGVCKVTLTESGFSKLPKEVAEGKFQQNSKGWDFMLGRLAEQFDGV
ncbi:MAG: SRPBCC family protein [Candidatus Omnitrophica bacterium]|nr:SRPBCC family protein [Candidatus Omnitrophota bacterium]